MMVAEKKRTESSRTAGISQAVRATEAHAMISAAPDDSLRLLLNLLWTTGGRITEVLSIRLMDVWPPDAIRLLNEKQHKRSADGYMATEYKTVYVPESVVSDVLAHAHSRGLRAQDYLFPGRKPGSHMDRRTAWKHTTELASDLQLAKGRPKTLYKPARLSPVHPRDFRHGTAVHLLENGALITTVQRQLGHKSIQTTGIYLDVTDEARRQDAKHVRF